MKTRISSQRNSVYEVLIDDGTKRANRRVLASMSLFEGTGLWMVTDIRLHRTREPSAYSGGLFSDDIHCSIKPKNAEEAKRVRAALREFYEEEDGTLTWSTFEGLVKGPRQDSAQSMIWSPNSHNGIGYFSKSEGLAYLASVQEWWATYEGDPCDAKIDNPNRQPSAMHFWMAEQDEN